MASKMKSLFVVASIVSSITKMMIDDLAFERVDPRVLARDNILDAICDVLAD